MGYKGEIEIPEKFKRNFHRIAALLEISDLEFVRIRDSLKEYEKIIENKITNDSNFANIDLNLASLTSYIRNSKLVEKIDIELCKLTNVPYNNHEADYNIELKMLYFLNIEKIDSLEESLIRFQNQIPFFAKTWIDISKNKGGITNHFLKGISIFYLCYILLAERKNPELSKNYFISFFKHDRSDDLIETYTALEQHKIS